jgi:hypothetical protein
MKKIGAIFFTGSKKTGVPGRLICTDDTGKTIDVFLNAIKKWNYYMVFIQFNLVFRACWTIIHNVTQGAVPYRGSGLPAAWVSIFIPGDIHYYYQVNNRI